MADDRSIRVRFIAEYQSYVQGLRTAAAETANFGREVSGHGKAVKADVEQVGRAALIMAGGTVIALGLAAKSAIDWESAWAGVTKTVDGTASQMASLEDGLRDLAGELPATHGEIAAVAEAAGALGIQTDAIEGFTKTMIDLGETTNVTADQAATSFAKIANIMGTSQTDFDRMGSTLVELGNNGASTEADILELANRLAAAGNIAGLTEADIFAMASTLASVGVEAEAGGSALSKVMTTVSDAVLDGSEKLDVFAKVAGVTADQFAASFRDDPAIAINDFVLGLGRMIESGQSLTPVFQDLELTDLRLMNALKSTAGAGDLLTQSLETGRQAWEDNNALQTEAEKRYDTTAAKMEIARNNIVDVGINIGNVLLPAVAGAAEGVSNLARGFGELEGPGAVAVTAIGGLTAGLVGTIGLVGTVGPKIVDFQKKLRTMGDGGKAVANNLGKIAMVAGTVTVGLTALSYYMGETARKAEAADERIKGFTDAIHEAGDASTGAADRIGELLAEAPELATLMDEAGVSAAELGEALVGSDADFGRMKDSLLEAGEAAGLTGEQMAILPGIIDNLRGEAQTGAEQAETLGRVMGDAGDAASDAAPKVGTLATELGLNAEEAEKARTEFEELLDAYRGAVDPLFAMLDALEANREAMGAEAEARAQAAADVAEAAEAVADAEKDLRDARGLPDNVEGIAAAEERLADARDRLTETQDGAVISAEELTSMYQDVAESALDVDVAMKELAAKIAEQPELLDTAKAMLAEWAEQGLLTADQAYIVGLQFGAAADQADKYAGDYVANAYANTDAALAAWKRLYDIIAATYKITAKGAPISIGQIEHSLGAPGAATGGVHSGLTWIGEQGPELVNLGSPSRVFPHRESMSMLGPTGLRSLNSGQTPAGSYDYSSRTENSWAPNFTIVAPSPAEAASSAAFRMRRLAAEMAAR